ncbi:DUF6542 domain-containing protein [Saccharothrix xinjiangensis]|uniref:DUF6542 domain-containing protein n=1 Tax=Saccharothrix xinjiangensis TaxID=204798 RepID=A0ABV9XZZ6_9PSEU
MTAATRDDSRSEPEDDLGDVDEAVRWNDRAMFGSFRGLPWWAAVLIAFVVAAVGAYVDLSSGPTVKWVFAVAFFVGCVGAVVFVERRSMFGPVVQPPLVLAIIVPLVAVVARGMPSGGLASIGIDLGKPLIDGFPAMAVTTLVTVVVGIVRVTTQKDPNRPTKDEAREAREARRKPKGERPEKPAKGERAEKPAKGERAEKPVAKERPEKPAKAAVDQEDRPKRPRPDGERRRPAAAAAASDEDRPKRPRPREGAPGDRPRRPASREGRPGQRKPRPPRDED